MHLSTPRNRSSFARSPSRALLLGLVVLLIAAACGGGGSPATETAAPATSAAVPSEPATIPASAVASATASTGVTVVADGVPATGTATSAGSPAPTPTPTPPPPSADQLTAMGFKLETVVKGLNQPISVTNDRVNAGRLYIIEKGGAILIEQDGKVSQTPFLDITGKVGSSGSEQGLLGLVFHPDYKTNRFFYVDYTDRNGNTIIARYTAAADGMTADPASAKQIMEIDQPYANHNGGQLAFGPDGMLYIGMGDGGSEGDPLGNGQKTTTLLGKILRIDVDHGDPYAIPPDNPFANGDGGKPEIWDFGFRNPWRFSFDRQTGDLYIGDVGQAKWEEIDHIVAGTKGGLNFGWKIMEGAHCYAPATNCDQSGLVLPISEIEHPAGCAIIGGYVYRGSQYPQLNGVYFYTDYCSGAVWAVTHAASGAWTTTRVIKSPSTYAGYSSFGEDLAGELYVTDLNGALYRLTAGK
jgi:glucose/arabinose dehydrogenase